VFEWMLEEGGEREQKREKAWEMSALTLGVGESVLLVRDPSSARSTWRKQDLIKVYYRKRKCNT